MRTVEIVITFLACFIAANFICHTFGDTKQYLPADLYSPLTVAAAAWILALIYSTKSVARLK